MITAAELDHLIEFVRMNFGIDLSKKRTFVEIKATKFMHMNGFPDYSSLYAKVNSDATGKSVSDLVSALAVNYTLFNRESMHFDYLRTHVLPELKEKCKNDKIIYSWSAGCSSGEEPYTMAMVFHDYFNVQKPDWDTRILATDISTLALKKAIDGAYLVEATENLPPLWINSYFNFKAGDDSYAYIAPKIREEVQFRNHNLVGNNFNFRHKFHFIFCRNVMIYFNQETKNKLIDQFYDLLEDGGYLFIGMSESLDTNRTKFKYVQPSIYRKEGRNNK